MGFVLNGQRGHCHVRTGGWYFRGGARRRRSPATPTGAEARGAKDSKRQKVASAPETLAATTPTYLDVVGFDVRLESLGKDSWGVVGSTVELPNELWDADEQGTTLCNIAHLLGPIKFPGGKTKHHAFAVSYEGADELYAVRALTVARYHERRSFLKKQPNPKPLLPFVPLRPARRESRKAQPSNGSP